MIMVVAYHWELHAKGDSVYRSVLSVNQIFSFAIGSWGSLGVDLFFMISAYFLIKNNNIKIVKLINLIIKVSFYGTGVLLLANLLNIEPFSIKAIINSLLGVFAYQYWFITVYILVYLMSPCLNVLIISLQKSYYVFILITLIYVVYVFAFINYGNGLIGRLACGVTIYLIIGFLEKYPKYNLFEKYRYIGSVILISGIVFLEIASSFLGTYYNITFYSIIRRIQITESPLMLVAALFILYLFKNFNIQYRKVINFIGKYSAGAYLLHGGGGGYIKGYLWDGLFKAGYYYEQSPNIYIYHYLLSIMLLFFVGIICEFIYVNTIEYYIKLKYSSGKFLKTIGIDMRH